MLVVWAQAQALLKKIVWVGESLKSWSNHIIIKASILTTTKKIVKKATGFLHIPQESFSFWADFVFIGTTNTLI